MPSEVFGPMPKSSAMTSNLRNLALTLQIWERNNYNNAELMLNKRLKNIKPKQITLIKAKLARLQKSKTGELGFEPRQTAPEAVVLPLHYSPRKKESDHCIKVQVLH